MGDRKKEKRSARTVKKDLFDILEETGVCHAIGINLQRMRLKTIPEISKQWFVLISQTDKKKLFGFKNSEGRTDTAEKELSKSEIETFRKRQGNYIKIIHNTEGRIYEQINNSLSKKIDYE